MSHRYNTRFQAKQAIQAKQANPTPSSPFERPLATIPMKQVLNSLPEDSNPSIIEMDVKKETALIKSMLDTVQEKDSSMERTLHALRIFHFLEWNHRTMRRHEQFRNTVHKKANQCIDEFKQRTEKLKQLSPYSTTYEPLKQLVQVTEELKNSCDRVLSIINAF